MAEIGASDRFERVYMQTFRDRTARLGEFVTYERDRGVRDIGIHLTTRLRAGNERLTTALVWFQLKGIMATTLTAAQFNSAESVALRLQVGHLRYWYLQPVPTYLVVYVECADTFLVLNVSEYVALTWGKAILRLDQKTATVRVPKDSILDDQAFRLIVQPHDIEEWKKALGTDNDQMGVCYRDYNLISTLGSADARGVTHSLEFWDWQSKTRGQLYVAEIDGQGNRTVLREHLQYMMSIDDVADAYPYLEFYALEDNDFWDDDELEAPPLPLPNGDVVYGSDAAGEYFHYEFGIRLNDVGCETLEWTRFLSDVGLVEIRENAQESLSVAPWHGRSV